MSDASRPTWPVGMYAPGSYTSKCSSCHQHFTGDKRARECPDCVIQAQAAEVERLQARIAELETVLRKIAKGRQVTETSAMDLARSALMKKEGE